MSRQRADSARLALVIAPLTICGLALGGLALPGDLPAGPVAPLALPGSGPTWQVGGGQAAAHFAASLASAGDVNGDGFGDIIVASPDYNSPVSANPHEGRASVFLGSALGPATQPVWTADGAQIGFGSSVASAGDVNGDGFDDIIVGEPDATLGPQGQPPQWLGQAALYLGSPSGPLPAPAWVGHAGLYARFGAAVAAAGDVNHDGYDDVIVGAPASPGNMATPSAVYLYLGSPGGLSSTPAWVLTGSITLESGGFGTTVTGAGDVNGDGYDDILVGWPGYTSVGGCRLGRAFLYLGGPGGLASATPAWDVKGNADCTIPNGSSFGSVLTSGHFNSDRFSDVVIGGSIGGPMLFLGSSSGLEATPTIQSAFLGYKASNAGDVNGDHIDDLIVGDGSFSNGYSIQGVARIYLGGSVLPSTTPVWQVQGDQFGSGFGNVVAGAGDTDGDGLANVLVGASLYDFSQPDDGAAFLFFGPVVTPCADDADGDGYCATGPAADCNDSAPAIHPNAVEICNGVDDDCNGRTDEGFGVGSFCQAGVGVCTASGTVACAADGTATCNTLPPGSPNPEVCDGLDNDCDGVIDDGLSDPTACRISSTTQVGAVLGDTVANVGDVNGDGFEDVLVSAPSDGQGRINLYYGTASGAFRAPDWTDIGTQTSNAPPTFTAFFGGSVAGIGDLNRDGYDDFIVGSPRWNYFQFQGSVSSYGFARIYLGGPGGPTRYLGLEGTGGLPSRFGSSVAGGGDLDGDGIDDIAVSAAGGGDFFPGVPPPSVTIYTKALNSATKISGALGSSFGLPVAIAPDLNGDGLDDLLIGSGNQVNVYYGSSSGIAVTPSLILSGAYGFAGAIAGVGDVNHDGYGDVLIGGNNSASLYLGSATGLATTPAWTSDGGQSGSRFGLSVAAAGDVNRDGFADLIVGAPDYVVGSQKQGAAYLFLGGAAGLDTAPIWVGTLANQAGAQFGFSVSGAGDYDGDGLDDVIIGSPGFNSGGAPFSGRADLVLSHSICIGADADHDGVSDCVDNCHAVANADQADADGDHVGDACDNCHDVSNSAQGDADQDGLGDACDPCTDTDHDGAGNPGFPANTCATDNCPSIANPDQKDFDHDGIGDACDTCTDGDGDGAGDPGFPLNHCMVDNCPLAPNPDQADADRDGLGDACDACPHDSLNDIDHDGVCGDVDNCPFTPNPGQEDRDGDVAGDACDNCPDLAGVNFPDQDLDGRGDVCDNCPAIANADQADLDGDGVGDLCDDCPSAGNPGQEDANHDGSGDACQPAVSITGFRSAGPNVLDALVSAHDPQGETLSGKVAVEAPVELLDALETMDCGRGYLPDGLPGRGIAFGNASIGEPYLFDLDSFLDCDDGAADFGIAFGPCAAPQGGFNALMPIAQLTLPATVCVRPVGAVQGGVDWTIVSIDSGSATVLIAGSHAVLEVPFTSSLPHALDISSLVPSQTHALAVTVTDGNTRPIRGSGIFQRTTERTLALVFESSSAPPHAVIAAPATAECAGPGGAVVAFDGSGSTDADSTPGTNDDIVSFDWYENYGTPGQHALGSGKMFNVGLALGTHAITLVATDHAGQTGTSSTTVMVHDTLPPTLTLHVDLSTLWPPNHGLVAVNATWETGDACDPAGVGVQLISLTSSEPDDAAGGLDGATTQDIQGAGIGTADTTFLLRAERDGTGSGRVYTLTYGARDSSGNATMALATVIVPHDLGQGPEPLLMRVEPASTGSSSVRIFWPEVAGASAYDVITGDLAGWRAGDGVIDVGAVQVLARTVLATSITESAGGAMPPVGHAFFYLIQQHTAQGTAGYGTETSPLPRVATTCDGGCPGALAPPPSGSGTGTTARK